MEAVGEPFVDSWLDEALEGRAVDFAQDALVRGVASDGVDVGGGGWFVVVGSNLLGANKSA